jgi:Transglycosylase-like domain
MRTRIGALVVGAALAVVPASAHSAQREVNLHQVTRYEKRYEEIRDRYVERFGLRAAGRDIVRDGVLDGGDARAATRDEVLRSIETMTSGLGPPAAAVETAAASAYGASGAASSTASCESGGDYSAVNPAGYYGAYQFDQETWDAYAPAGYQGVNPASAPPAVQDTTAASVPYDAWPNCP